MKRYDYLIVGAGLYGAVFARELTQRGKSCLVIDRRNHVAGNIYTEKMAGINVHKYGAHIFHTSDRDTKAAYTTPSKVKLKAGVIQVRFFSR